jgi:hypothetical protein
MGLLSTQKRQPPAGKASNCPLAWFRLLKWLFPALQPVMLVIPVLMALFLGIGDLGVPSTFLHDFPGPENGVFKWS